MTTLRPTYDVANDVARGIVANQGATISAVHKPAPATGYVVASGQVPETVHVLAAHDVFDHALAFVDAHRALLAWPNRYVGAWVDGRRFVLDVVEIHAERAHALALAVARGETAIFNLATGETIYL